jgi:hypothetical protein
MKTKLIEPELTTKQAAEILGVSPHTIFRYVRTKQLPCRRIQEHGRKPSLRFGSLALQTWADAMGFAVSGVASASSTPVPPIAGLSEIVPGQNILQRVQMAERQAFDDWKVAERTGKAPMFRQKLWLAWVRALVDLEKSDLKTSASRAEITRQCQAVALAFIEKWFEPVRELLKQMPGELAGRCNPADKNFAEEALRNWCNGQLNPMLSRNVFPSQ